MKQENLIGKKFTYLTVIGQSQETKNGRYRYFAKCKCKCGNIVRVVRGNLKNGNTKSCGCLNKELIKKRFITHKMSCSKPWFCWAHIKQRCLNKKDKFYKNYGGRGIKICKKWLDFEGFWEDMKDGYKDNLTLDRIDNDGNYCKKNCRWITHKQQQRNKTNNNFITVNGKTKTVSEWEEKMGFSRNTIYSRINLCGWSEEKAVTTPLKYKRRVEEQREITQLSASRQKDKHKEIKNKSSLIY